MAIKVPSIPSPDGIMGSNGKFSTSGYEYLKNLAVAAKAIATSLASAQAQQEAIDVSIEYPQNQDYPIEIDAPYGYTITKVDSYCASGSCTAAVKIGSTALGGGANSVSTTLQSVSHSSANTVALAGTTLVTISANSSCNRLRLTLWITRT